MSDPGPAGPSGVPSVVSLGPDPRPPRRRRRVVVATAAATLVLAAALAAPELTGQLTGQSGRGRSAPADLRAVTSYAGLAVDHTTGPVSYPTTPPVGGAHDPVWLECGAYDEPVRDENAVHDLEHGTVWIAYDPDLSHRDVDALRRQLPQNGIMAPYPGLRAPVVVTVWGRQLRLTGADDPRLALFVARFGHGETAPEPTASCAGGSRDPRGGRAPDGTAV